MILYAGINPLAIESQGFSPEQDMPIGEKIRKEMNPDKQIEQRASSVENREQIERGTMPSWQVDVIGEGTKNSSMWPEIENIFSTFSQPSAKQKIAHTNKLLLIKLGEVVRKITAPKIAAAYARTVLAEKQFPHVHISNSLWKSAVWNGSVSDPTARLRYTITPELNNETWDKLAASQVVLKKMNINNWDKEGWQEIIEDEKSRDNIFGFCENALAEGRCGR